MTAPSYPKLYSVVGKPIQQISIIFCTFLNSEEFVTLFVK